MSKKLFNKKDIIVFLCLIAVAVVCFFFISRENGETVEIWRRGKLYETYDLNTPFELSLENGVIIKCDGKEAWFEVSDCPDKVCINTGRLSISGEWAACLPNETVIKIRGNDSVDVVS